MLLDSLGVRCTPEVTQTESLYLLPWRNFLSVVAPRLSNQWAAWFDWQYRSEGRLAQYIQSETDVVGFFSQFLLWLIASFNFNSIAVKH